jgi:hypothetical protein
MENSDVWRKLGACILEGCKGRKALDIQSESRPVSNSGNGEQTTRFAMV